VGLISNERYEAFLKEQEKLNSLKETLRSSKLMLDDEKFINILSTKTDIKPEHKGENGYELVRRPGITTAEILEVLGEEADASLCAKCDIEIKYEGYIEKARKEASRMLKMDKVKLPDDLDYLHIDNLALEARAKLDKIRPASLGQTSRISGINPSDIQVLAIYLKQKDI